MDNEEKLDGLLTRWLELTEPYLDIPKLHEVLIDYFGLSEEGVHGNGPALIRSIVKQYPTWSEERKAKHPYDGWPVGLWASMIAWEEGCYDIPDTGKEVVEELVKEIQLVMRPEGEVLH